MPENFPSAEDTSADSATAVFLAWEKLRVVYNLALVLVTLLVGSVGFYAGSFWATAVVGAIIANICYCLGPCLEGYLALIGWPRRETRQFLFLVGTLLAAFLAAAATFSSVVTKWWS